MVVQYEGIDAAVVRAAVCDMSGLPDWPDLTSQTPEHVRRWCAWLRELWRDEALAEAIEIASPALAAAVQEICSGRVEQPRRVRRAVESMIAYALRMRTRPTPFGLFAGVAPVGLGAQAVVDWGEAHRAVGRPDARWLAELISGLEADPEVLRALSVMVNTMAFVQGDRLVIPSQPNVNDAGEVIPSDIGVRYSRPVEMILHAARSPVLAGDLIAKLAAAFPDTAEHVIGSMLAELVASGVLITGLRPSMDVTDPLGLVERVASNAGQTSWSDQLDKVQRILTRYAAARSGSYRRALGTAASARMAGLRDRPGSLIAVDMRLDCEVVLPSAVIREAEAATSALVRLTPHPHGNPAWQAWHGKFIERYGPGAVVPIVEIVDADRGLGYPAGYRGSPHTPPASVVSARDRALLRLAERAVLDGSGEVVLDDADLAELTADTDPGRRPPHAFPHTELRFSLHAATPGALDRGAFTLVVASATRQAGTSIGRFLHLFEGHDRVRISDAFRALPTLNAGALAVQVSCPPLSLRSQNLARTPALFPLISLAEFRPLGDKAQIALDDLAVTGDAHRMFLVRMSTGRIVEPLMLNALEFRHGTHPLARFLCEITTARAAACIPFSWGAAAGQPFLPRVRYRRSVLRPACWNVRAADLPGRRVPWPDWEKAWMELRRTYRIPQMVYLGELDVVIGLDLDESAHRVLLRNHLDRSGSATMTEAPDDHAYEWINGRPHEIALPLARTSPPLEAPPVLRRNTALPALRHVGHVPGVSPWLYARLYGHPDRQTELLTAYLPSLLATWPYGNPDAWFVRCRQGEPHLRVRVRLDDADAYGSAARHLGEWADRLRRAGLLNSLVLDTYHPEIGRYGTGSALEAAEAVFAADSIATIAQLAVTVCSAGLHPQAITALSMLKLATAFTGLNEGFRWLVDHVSYQGGPALSRELRDQITRMLGPGDGQAACALPGGERLQQAWELRHQAVTTYRSHLSGPDTRGTGPDPDRVLASLLHMHHARMIGIEAESERVCLRLARAVALSWIARTQGEGHPRTARR